MTEAGRVFWLCVLCDCGRKKIVVDMARGTQWAASVHHSTAGGRTSSGVRPPGQAPRRRRRQGLAAFSNLAAPGVNTSNLHGDQRRAQATQQPAVVDGCERSANAN